VLAFKPGTSALAARNSWPLDHRGWGDMKHTPSRGLPASRDKCRSIRIQQNCTSVAKSSSSTPQRFLQKECGQACWQPFFYYLLATHFIYGRAHEGNSIKLWNHKRISNKLQQKTWHYLKNARLLRYYAAWLLYEPMFRRNVRWYVPLKHRFLQEPHCPTSHNTAFFILT
jgi:hypothetical protein